MERDGYNIPIQECQMTLNGAINIKNKTGFLGDNIYTPAPEVELKICNEKNTYVDCLGRPKFTLPLDRFSQLKQNHM